jgi:tetratricopeptide (TPR) repeat protein
MDKSHSPAYHGLGLIFDKLGKYDEAIRYFNKAIEYETQNSIYWHNRGCSYRNLGK